MNKHPPPFFGGWRVGGGAFPQVNKIKGKNRVNIDQYLMRYIERSNKFARAQSHNGDIWN